MIKINNISKSYGRVKALNDVCLDVKKGELYGLIGPDGAGKTTLIRIIMTLMLPDQGEVFINDIDTVKNYKWVRKNVGYMPGNFSLYKDLTVEENLRFFASVYGTDIKTHYELIAPVYEYLKPFRNRRADKLSGGMKQKLALSCSLIHRPQLLVLDEPTTGVDAVSRQEFWEMLKKMKNHGITVFVSTPYMDEARLCDRVSLIQKGKILETDTPKSIVLNYKHYLLRAKTRHRIRLIRDLRAMNIYEKVYPFGEYIHCSSLSKPDLKEIQNYLTQLEHEDIEVVMGSPDIEDRFIELMTE
jgi:ABC-type multidrug transport system ATPase subunit